MTTDSGPLPVGNGEPGTAASAPLVLFIRRTETLLDPLFAVTRKLPEGSVSAETGPVPPLAKGDPLTAVRAPVLPLTLYVEMVFSAVLDTNKTFPAGSSTTDEGSEPVGGRVNHCCAAEQFEPYADYFQIRHSIVKELQLDHRLAFAYVGPESTTAFCFRGRAKRINRFSCEACSLSPWVGRDASPEGGRQSYRSNCA